MQLDGILSWVVAISGFAGTWFVGRKMYTGWIILAITQVIWIIYGALVHHWSFILSGVVYIFICTKSALDWLHSSCDSSPITTDERTIINDVVAELHTS